MSEINFIFTKEDFYPELIKKDTEELSDLQLRFQKNRHSALYQMGFEEKPEDLTPAGSFLFLLSETFIRSLTAFPGLELERENAKPEPAAADLEELLRAVPFSVGAEYITESWIRKMFERLNAVFSEEIKAYNGTVALYLAGKNQKLHVAERIFFHLVESKDEKYPFAFLATYATRQENGEMFHPLRLTSEEAYEFLKDIEAIEETGILCRIPNWWRKKSAVPALAVSLGDEKPSMLGFDTLVAVKPKLMVDGVELSETDIRKLLSQTEGLALLKGKWIEVDHVKLRELLAKMEELPEEVTLRDAMQMEMGNHPVQVDVGPMVSNGKWLSSLFMHLRKPETIRKASVPKSIHATLRPYQKSGYAWLGYMDKLGFGACLADDMGLGKTLQVLTYLERLRKENPRAKVLLVVPASLIGNWQRETQKFAPKMDLMILHGQTAAVLEAQLKNTEVFLNITTYGMVSRIKGLQEIKWDCVILDEAQAIKNPGTKQTREIKKLHTKMRIALTGTPIGNDLTNLWSLFDFLNKGLLGTSKGFHDYCKRLNDHPEGYQKLKTMVAPFMLRRLKTDKSIIADLPDKVESVDYVSLTKKQVVLYRKVVADMEALIAESEGIKRSGIILTTIMKLKQICNHPDQYLGQTGFAEKESG